MSLLLPLFRRDVYFRLVCVRPVQEKTGSGDLEIIGSEKTTQAFLQMCIFGREHSFFDIWNAFHRRARSFTKY